MQRLSNVLEKVLLGIAGAMLVFSAFLMSAEVIKRYLIGSSIIWAEEIISILMLYSTFIASGPILKRGEHVRMTVVYERFPDWAQKYLDIIISIAGILTSAFLCWGGIILVLFLHQIGMMTFHGARIAPWVVALGLPLGTAFLTFYFVINLFIKKGKPA